MMQNFQCPICGNYNAFGEPECSQCKQAFVYNCPVCGTHINNLYNKCSGCGAVFNWGKQNSHKQINNIVPNDYERLVISPSTQPATTDTGPAAPSLNADAGINAPDLIQTTNNSPGAKQKIGLFSNWRFWVILMLACVILTTILFLIDIFLLRK